MYLMSHTLFGITNIKLLYVRLNTSQTFEILYIQNWDRLQIPHAVHDKLINDIRAQFHYSTMQCCCCSKSASQHIIIAWHWQTPPHDAKSWPVKWFLTAPPSRDLIWPSCKAVLVLFSPPSFVCSSSASPSHKYSRLNSVSVSAAHTTASTGSSSTSPAHTATALTQLLTRSNIGANTSAAPGSGGERYSVPLHIVQQPESKQPAGNEAMLISRPACTLVNMQRNALY